MSDKVLQSQLLRSLNGNGAVTVVFVAIESDQEGQSGEGFLQFLLLILNLLLLRVLL